VGLVGFPNAGKSTLLSVLSAAKPKIAGYAFTTLTPQLGIVEYRDGKSFCVADLPGIIEGAAEGKGLGHRFLRHIERNAVLLFVIPADSDNHAKEFDILLHELKKYNPALLQKDFFIAISKSDLLDEELQQAISKELPADIPHLFISSLTKKNIPLLKDKLWELMNKYSFKTL
jgi:GTP-binding protein